MQKITFFLLLTFRLVMERYGAKAGMAPLLLIVNLHRQNAGSVIKEKMMEHTDRVEPAAVD